MRRLTKSLGLLTLAATLFLPSLALASEAAAEAAPAGGEGLPLSYAIQWMLLLGLLSVTILFVLASLSWTPKQLRASATGRVILAFSALQVFLVLATLAAAIFSQEYVEPVFAGYARHVVLLLTGALVSGSAFMNRRKRR